MKVKREKSKKGVNAVLIIIIIFLLTVIFLMFKSLYLGDRITKLEVYLTEYYYSPEHLELAMKNTLGDVYEENGFSNFDNYLYKLVIDDVNKYEPAEIQKYNAIFSRERSENVMEQINEVGEVSVSLLEDGICYIKIGDFSKGETYEMLTENMDILNSADKFIIDLRGNNGGYIEELIKTMSLFYPNDQVVFTELRGGELREHTAFGKSKLNFEKIAFLCDEHTASSAEVMIFNMNSDFDDKVFIVGKSTYGKYFQYSFDKSETEHLFIFVSGLMCNAEGETFGVDGIAPEYEAEGEQCLETARNLLKN
ncbi:MAG: hypothetical protein HDT25_09050 [Ruminococcus sp.]|nr:hypothetical protein [Ruminococcus sp.]